MKLAVQLANDVLDMHERIQWLEHEVARLADYEAKYSDLLGENIEHNQRMFGGLFQLGMKLAGTGYFGKDAEQST